MEGKGGDGRGGGGGGGGRGGRGGVVKRVHIYCKYAANYVDNINSQLSTNKKVAANF